MVTTTTTATLDANGEVCGPTFVKERATYVVDATGTITVTPQISHDNSVFAPYATGLTADGAGVIWGPCWARLIASSVSGGSAVCSIQKKD